MSHCHGSNCSCAPVTAAQTMEELEFERGIWYAAQTGDLDRVKKLCRGTNPDKKDTAGYTALHYAARNGHLNVCKYLLENGADVDAVTREGKATALCRASSMGKEDVVKYLISKKANVFLQDSDGKTALHRAAESKHLGICEILLKLAPSLKEVADNKGSKIDLIY